MIKRNARARVGQERQCRLAAGLPTCLTASHSTTCPIAKSSSPPSAAYHPPSSRSESGRKASYATPCPSSSCFAPVLGSPARHGSIGHLLSLATAGCTCRRLSRGRMLPSRTGKQQRCTGDLRSHRQTNFLLAREVTRWRSSKVQCASAQPLQCAAQNRLISRGGLKSMGWLSGVALSSSFHILIVLSASHVTRREPVWSKDIA